jgi:rod shape-determining protein MreC
MRNSTRKFRSLLIISSLLLFSLYLLFSHSSISRDPNKVYQIILTIFSPVLEGIADISDNIQQTWEEYIAIRDARRENRDLKKELARGRNLISEALEYQLENERLRNLLSFRKKESRLSMIAGEVIGKDSSRWFQTILINKGSDNNLTRNMAVLTPEGVVGYIIGIAPAVSKVLLISDINSSISAIVQRTRTQVIIVGSGGEFCRTKFLPNTEDILEGDTIVTSGLGGIYPKGLIVGHLRNIVKKSSGLFLDAERIPGADLDRLEAALIVTDKLYPGEDKGL